ncbi:MAG: DUF1585 domain-containing protein, partial [Verrucomicrobiales bacterium]|nr:DUF1585 domain-containing protein [Verrucomicrobiales bacterium]
PVIGFGKNGHAFQFRLAKLIDCGGGLEDGRLFKNIADLKKLFLGDERKIAQNLLHQFIVYATGAPVSFADRIIVEDILDQCEGGGYGVRSLILALIESKLFLHK